MSEHACAADTLDADLQQVLMKLWLFLRRGDAHYLKVGSGLTMAQLSILVALFDEGPMRLSRLAEHERLRAPTITVAIRRLEKLGLVERFADPSDQRAVLIKVTALGLANHRQALADRQAVLTTAMADLSDDELAVVGRALISLQRLAGLAAP